MKYPNIVEGVFLERKNRFIARCLINGLEEEVYVPNTGRCREIFTKGAEVFLSLSDNPLRKTRYTLVSIYKDSLLINIDSSAPNKVIEEAIVDKRILGDYTFLSREKTYDKSRFDLYMEKDEEKSFIEVKGVTLEVEGHSYFPDAPTLRGLKHVNELIKAKGNGYNSYIIFLIQMDGVEIFSPNWSMHREFAQALVEAHKRGVKILAFNSKVSKDEIKINNRCQVILGG